MDQDATWYGGRPQPRGLCVRWGPNPSPQKRFSAHVDCGQTAAWIKMQLGTEVGLRPDDIVLDEDPAPLPNFRFRPISIVTKRLDGSRWHLAYS